MFSTAALQRRLKQSAYLAASYWSSTVETVSALTMEEVKIPDLKHPDLSRQALLHQPKHFRLTLPEAKSLCRIGIIRLGCQGGGGAEQKAVAALANKVALPLRSKVDALIIKLLGDNFYPKGVDHPDHSMFVTHFYQMYRDEKLEGLKDIPIFLILGNHCVRLCMDGRRAGDLDFNRAYAQIMHTYVKCDNPEMYLADTLDLSKLPAFNMPRRFYSSSIEGDPKKGEGALLEFNIDWNTFVRDYLKATSTDDEYLKKFKSEKDNPDNQFNHVVATCRQLHKKYKERLIITVDSHGPRTVHDKGIMDPPNIKNDLYLTQLEIDTLKREGVEGTCNDFFNHALLRMGFDLDVTYSADTHALLNFITVTDDDRMIYQVGAGGGGNPTLEDKCDLNNKDKLWYIKKHGCVVSVLDLKDKTKTIRHDFYTTDGLHLAFDKRSPAPIPAVQEEAKLQQLRTVVDQAYNEYYAVLTGKDQLAIDAVFHGVDGINRADEVYSYFHQCEAIPYLLAVKYLRTLFECHRHGLTRETSFISLMNKAMLKELHVSFEEFAKKPEFERSQSRFLSSSPHLDARRRSSSTSSEVKPMAAIELGDKRPQVDVHFAEGMNGFADEMRQFTL